eukprot:TRINITY_DN12940_c0_g1_i12.p3 TRINITY_DN12940_c0_g1~~TRINITY_DN12940_c0_g1_i12.p3  ORF type:complete len:126 (+),score=17.17 TRINITY_DN12940_c0_g1_i12:154-531(+)
MNPNQLSFRIFLSVKLVLWIWDEYLRHRHLEVKENDEMPSILRERLTDNDYTASQGLATMRTYWRRFLAFSSITVQFALLIAGAFPDLWSATAAVAELVGADPKSDVKGCCKSSMCDVELRFVLE